MTTDREVMQMALHAMHSAREFLATVEDHRARLQETRLHDAMREARNALAQGEQKPVAWRWLYAGKPEGEQCFSMPSPDADIVARAAALEFPRTVQYLYTAPPQREWVELTDEEIRNEAKNHVFDESFFSGAIWARGKMMGKNYD